MGILLGGATQALISWWESGRYLLGPRYLPKLNQFLSVDPLALGVFTAATVYRPKPSPNSRRRP